jgi:hypothetical protein
MRLARAATPAAEARPRGSPRLECAERLQKVRQKDRADVAATG